MSKFWSSWHFPWASARSGRWGRERPTRPRAPSPTASARTPVPGCKDPGLMVMLEEIIEEVHLVVDFGTFDVAYSCTKFG